MSNELPSEVVTCLKNARYLHLATSDGLWPHVSLMNYTYLPAPSPDHALPPPPSSSPAASSGSTTSPIIILTLQPTARSTYNVLSNPRVSLLVHDWVSHRRTSLQTPVDPSHSLSPATTAPHTSSLQEMLTNLNTAALSSISATLFGYSTLLEPNSPAEQYYKKIHEENNPRGATDGRCYLEGEDVRVLVVRVAWARVADYKGFVRDWVGEGGEPEGINEWGVREVMS
ncbi:hypothetical protein EX30DRAFT_329188 [Ascodesmis nigricans]|uniref:Uncharacterized protein n=1 Tax=Ascodesmis nigricans TaxID=341454 RepID=A0A4V3SJ96_9PEZI|nr:hypothetical protein EX30DRAFT_329188 [Ascodesmis nigricans]